jgi:uncharacterized protein (TIGR01777 family)
MVHGCDAAGELDMSKRVFVTGGTGFVGSALVEALSGRGDRVVVLSRDAARARARLPPGVDVVAGDPGSDSGSWQGHLAGADAVVHLAGASIAGKRWDARYKQILRDSRVESTRHVVEGMAALPEDQRPRVLVCASGADYYPGFDGDGVGDDDDVTESAPSGESFLARMCVAWEAEAQAAAAAGARVVCMRTAVVLGERGALPRMLLPFKLFAGGPLGSGRQWFSWIHIEDAIRGYLFAIDEPALAGPVNLSAPDPVRFKTFTSALGRVLHRPSWLPVPGFAVKAAAGELGEYLLHGRRVVPAALQAHGFVSRYPTLDNALRDLLAG